MESPEDRRCKRSDGSKWRCSETASFGKSYCKKHLAQMENQRKRIQRDKNKRSHHHELSSSADVSESSESELNRIRVSQPGGKCGGSVKRIKKCTAREAKFTEKVKRYIYLQA